VASTSRVVGGSLEQANVSMVDRMAGLTDVSRSFEALQRGLSVLLNDIDGRAITELGRR
jgi:flagellar basal body rod protein FlgG